MTRRRLQALQVLCGLAWLTAACGGPGPAVSTTPLDVTPAAPQQSDTAEPGEASSGLALPGPSAPAPSTSPGSVDEGSAAPPGLAAPGPSTSTPAAEGPPIVEGPSEDPRNWPTASRLVMDRHELAGRVFTLRVHGRRSDYFNCHYVGTEDQYVAYSLLAGPNETLSGYVPRETAQVLDRILATDPWAPLTVQVSFDPSRLSDRCPDQVEVLKWSRGWHYPPESLSPARPDPSLLPSPATVERLADQALWKELVALESPLVSRQIEIGASARLSTTYHCAFRNAWRTHWGLQLTDGRGRSVLAFVARTEDARALIDHVALHREVALVARARVVQLALSTYCPPQLELMSWRLPASAPASPADPR
jgi:hypothetical protein